MKHQKSSNCGIASLKMEGKLVSHPTAQADILKRQLQSVFNEGRSYTYEELQAKCDIGIQISIEGARKLIHNLQPNKASGPYSISPRILRELATEVVPILTAILQPSINTGVVPFSWKDAHVTPIFSMTHPAMLQCRSQVYHAN